MDHHRIMIAEAAALVGSRLVAARGPTSAEGSVWKVMMHGGLVDVHVPPGPELPPAPNEFLHRNTEMIVRKHIFVFDQLERHSPALAKDHLKGALQELLTIQRQRMKQLLAQMEGCMTAEQALTDILTSWK